MNLTRALHDRLAQSAAALAPGEGPLQSIRVEPRGTVFEAALVFPRVTRRFAVKPMPPQGPTPRDLHGIQSAVRAQSPLLRDALIPICAAEDEHHCIIMPWAAGQTFEALLHAALRSAPAVHDARITACLDHTARILARVHRLRAAAFKVQPAAHPNHQYLPSLERCWRHDLLSRALPAGVTAAELFDAHCTHAFCTRLGDRLLPADVQPKNQIVADTARVTLIDPGFNAGHPAMTLVGFLLALDRLAPRHPSRGALGRIDAWKRYLLHAYAARGEAWVTDDLRLFYPWALVRTFDQHARARPLWRAYLSHIYTRTLRIYLHDLAQTRVQPHPPRALAA